MKARTTIALIIAIAKNLIDSHQYSFVMFSNLF